MQGYQITFFTQQDRQHNSVPLVQWLFAEAKRQGIRGATVSASLEGMGHDGMTHAAGWFDLADQPVQVTMIVTAEESDRLFASLQAERVKIFYMKAPVEFGFAGRD